MIGEFVEAGWQLWLIRSAVGLWVLIAHLIIMASIHIIDLEILKVPSKYRSLDVWMEILINGFASVLMPSKIKFTTFGYPARFLGILRNS